MEAYRSGHNEPDSKSGVPQGTVGSNPTASANASVLMGFEDFTSNPWTPQLCRFPIRGVVSNYSFFLNWGFGMTKRNGKISCYFFIATVAMFLYCGLFLLPYADRFYHSRLSDGVFSLACLQYFLLSAPVLIGYAVFSWKSFKCLHVTSLAYPLMAHTLLLALLASSEGHTGILFDDIVLDVVFIAMLAVNFVIGLFSDIAYIRKKNDYFPKLAQKLVFLPLLVAILCGAWAYGILVYRDNTPVPVANISRTGDSGYEQPREPIPSSLGESFEYLNELLSPEDIEWIKNSELSDLIALHFGLGMWMRNHWLNQPSSGIAEELLDMGFTHLDNMSQFIIEAYHHYLNGLDYEARKS